MPSAAHRFGQIATIIAITSLTVHAQTAENPAPAPDDISLQFKTEGDQHQFHLGELIPITLSYTTKTPGKYLWMSNSTKLNGGHSIRVSCSPPVENPKENAKLGESDYDKFEQMLAAGCGGAGVGGGVGGGCGDCDGEVALGTAALGFGIFPLNEYVRLRKPGTYTCQASSAEITSTPRGEKNRPALLVKSNPVVLTIVDEPAWSHSAGETYADAYEMRCRGDDVPEQKFLECSDLARRITYLDTRESLATEVKEFDGRNHRWDNGFWDAIRTSSRNAQPSSITSDRGGCFTSTCDLLPAVMRRASCVAGRITSGITGSVRDARRP